MAKYSLKSSYLRDAPFVIGLLFRSSKEHTLVNGGYIILFNREDIVRVLNPSISTGLKMEVNIMALDREIINANGTQVEAFRNNDLNAELIKNNISEFWRTHMSKRYGKRSHENTIE